MKAGSTIFRCMPVTIPAPRREAAWSRSPRTRGSRLVPFWCQLGDYVIADASAVVFIREADISRVLDAAEKIVEKEKLMAEAIRSGTPIGQVMGADYESMLKR